MNRWLAEESKWARKQAIATRTKIDELLDPEWRSRRVRAIAASEQRLLQMIEEHVALTSEALILQDPSALAAHVERLRREAEQWDTLAAEQSARLEHTDDE